MCVFKTLTSLDSAFFEWKQSQYETYSAKGAIAPKLFEINFSERSALFIPKFRSASRNFDYGIGTTLMNAGLGLTHVNGHSSGKQVLSLIVLELE